MVEQVFAANPALESAIEAGVEVELGVYVWGAFVPGEGLASLPEPLAGLADEERSWTVGFRRLIVATGARDVAFSFDGWDQPGVMGARGFASLIETYDAFAGRRIAILGSGALAVRTARLALDRDLEVVAIVEARPETQTPATELAVLGAPVFTGYVPDGAASGLDGVTAVRLRDRSSGMADHHRLRHVGAGHQPDAHGGPAGRAGGEARHAARSRRSRPGERGRRVHDPVRGLHRG